MTHVVLVLEGGEDLIRRVNRIGREWEYVVLIIMNEEGKYRHVPDMPIKEFT